jgi:hypothetical protein
MADLASPFGAAEIIAVSDDIEKHAKWLASSRDFCIGRFVRIYRKITNQKPQRVGDVDAALADGLGCARGAAKRQPLLARSVQMLFGIFGAAVGTTPRKIEHL